ncbi:LCP family protein [Patulibacter sp. NPDC049589]|uniref:LCP family protein n=1 Tax=Patulibacter sp. NPDC049589 TaxID=3154731 RepID=UPI003437A21B
MSTPSDLRPPSPGTTFALRFLLAGIVVLIIAGAVVAATIQHEATTLVSALPPETKASKEAKGVLDDVQAGKPQTMLLVGDDARIGEESGQRSDTMILVRLDEDAKVTSMLSLPRDLIVAGGSSARLNASNVGKGPAGLIVQLKRILSTPQEPFEINHYVSIRFSAFSAAVKAFGCFYVDVDRKYYNDNNPPAGGGNEPYAAIDVPAGYQRLCGEDSLSYVRFRHLDNDVVREARQAHYLAEARAQIAASKLITEGTKLAKTILGFVDTDIRKARGLLGVVKLGLNVVGKPTKRITLDTTDTKEGALQTTPADLATAARRFLHPGSTPKSKPSQDDAKPTRTASGKRKKKAAPKIPATLTANASAAAVSIRNSGIAKNFTAAPIYLPKLVQNGAVYKDDYSRGYDIASANGRSFPWQGYRLVVAVDGARGGIGQYYGIQGTSWKKPPVLELATDEVTLAGRKWRIEYDGARIRRLIWSTPNGTYWINNSLKNSLTNNEMRAIARSLVPYRASSGQ